jgi:hypothetical protein
LADGVQAKMSKCAHGVAGSTNLRRNSAAVIAPPNPPVVTLLVSAIFESSIGS